MRDWIAYRSKKKESPQRRRVRKDFLDRSLSKNVSTRIMILYGAAEFTFAFGEVRREFFDRLLPENVSTKLKIL